MNYTAVYLKIAIPDDPSVSLAEVFLKIFPIIEAHLLKNEYNHCLFHCEHGQSRYLVI
jgi:hypothetical protein